MKITILVDDVYGSKNNLEIEHGLSLYIEQEHKNPMLFDVGATDMFIRNSERLNLSIEKVDRLILSHGHCDHTGGLEAFFSKNDVATVYGTPNTFRDYYSLKPTGDFVNIGTPVYYSALPYSRRLVLNDGFLSLGVGDFLFSDVWTTEFLPESNSNLYALECYDQDTRCLERINNSRNHSFVLDTFLHEQNLVLTSESGKKILVVGCSHRGIVNIMNRFIEIIGTAPDYVIGGFHLLAPSHNKVVSYEFLNEIAQRLSVWNSQYIVGHCVGIKAFEHIRRFLDDQVVFFGTGDSFVF